MAVRGPGGTARGGGSAAGRARFDGVYDQPDPRAYCRRLAPLEYQTPRHAQPVFRRLYAERAALPGGAGQVTVLDLCCSYGINPALLNHDLTLGELYARYTDPEVAGVTTEELIERDRQFYASRRRPGAARVIGLDAAGNAVRYALAVGLLDEGFAENLEQGPPSARLRAALADTGLITVTGSSDLTARTYGALVACARVPVWVAAFVLRTVRYEPVAACLAAHGLVTQEDSGRSYPQRRFTGPEERLAALAAVEAAGRDPAGRETEGYFHTTLYVSRPRPARGAG